MNTYFIPDGFFVPPENQGQMVEYAYGLDPDDMVVVCRRTDRSDGEISYTAYVCPDDSDFEPWNCRPKMGKRIGDCLIEHE